MTIGRLKEPVAIFGAGGFIGVNLLMFLLKEGTDVVGLSRNPGKSWRFKEARIPRRAVVKCDLLNPLSVARVIKKVKPKTVFNLAAYGAYARQKSQEQIYRTNFLSTVTLLEELRKHTLSSYIHAGSQSEYGFNCSGPGEEDELEPNSHYAISKTAVFYLLKYFGRVHSMPVIHTRLYSVYGPYEESDRLIATLIKSAKEGVLPAFVDPHISRDFIHVDDVVEAFVTIATRMKRKHYGEAFNIATGVKTTIRSLANMAVDIFEISKKPQFGSMKSRKWDLKQWYGNPAKMKREFGWEAVIDLKEGLMKTFAQ